MGLAKAWGDLSPPEHRAAVALGFDEEFPYGRGGARWANCREGWGDLRAEDRANWEVLGFNEAMWTRFPSTPARPPGCGGSHTPAAHDSSLRPPAPHRSPPEGSGRQVVGRPPAVASGGQRLGYKTKLCRHHQMGRCAKGDLCTYAHGPQDLRPHA